MTDNSNLNRILLNQHLPYIIISLLTLYITRIFATQNFQRQIRKLFLILSLCYNKYKFINTYVCVLFFIPTVNCKLRWQNIKRKSDYVGTQFRGERFRKIDGIV